MLKLFITEIRDVSGKLLFLVKTIATELLLYVNSTSLDLFTKYLILIVCCFCPKSRKQHTNVLNNYFVLVGFKKLLTPLQSIKYSLKVQSSPASNGEVTGWIV